MKSIRVLIFILSVIVLLGIGWYLFPAEGVKVGDLSLRYPSYAEEKESSDEKEVTQPKNEIPKNAFKYKVKKGNTLSHIAQRYHVTVSELMEWNHLETDLIQEGQELYIIRKKKK